MKVAVLAGGGGGARFVRALVESLPPADVAAIGNVGDDVEILGLHVSPDLDSLLYTLGGLIDKERGWGRAEETWNALETAGALGGETWFRLGDRDLGLHLVRTEALRRGEPLSAVTARFTSLLGVEAGLLPATDDRVRTWVQTPAGRFAFQVWFVGRSHNDPVDGVEYEGAKQAAPAPGVLEVLGDADLIAIAPSNPYLSVGPILAVEEIRSAVEYRRVPAIAVSPLIEGKAVMGPVDRMLVRLAGGTDPAHVAALYRGLIDAIVLDETDAVGAPEVAKLGIEPVVGRTLMRDAESRSRLVETVLEAAAARV